MSNFQLHQRQAEHMSTGTLLRELGHAERRLSVTAKEVDALIANDLKDVSIFCFESKTKECRRLSSIIRAISEELGFREVES